MFIVSESKSVFQRIEFPGNTWPSFVYKSFDSGVESVVQCAGLCKAEPANCNTVFYDKINTSCALANLDGNYSILQKTNDFGYIMQGILIILFT